MRFRLALFVLFCSFLLTASGQVQFYPPLQQTIFVIEGSPEGRVFMDVGILLVDRNSGKLWQKRTTRAVNTGWVDVSAGSGGGTGTALNFSSQFSVTADTNIFIASGASITNAALVSPTISALADVTTGNASTTAHGFVPKLPNDVTLFYNGIGGYTAPAGGGGGSATNLTPWTTDINGNQKSLTNAATINANSVILFESDLGTIANGGTATLVLATNIYRAAFSGATATIALPTITITTNSYWLRIFGTNTSGGSQVITIPALIRDELSPTVPVTTITNNTAAGFRMTFEASGGVWRNVDASGDALSFSIAGNWSASGSTNSALLGNASANAGVFTNGLSLAGSNITAWAQIGGAGGGGAPVGTMVESGIVTAGVVPQSSDTTGTNFVGSPITIVSVTNASLAGVFSANRAEFTNGIVGNAKGYITVDQAGTNVAAVNVTNMVFSIAANEVWTAEFNLGVANSAGSSGVQIAFTVPAGATLGGTANGSTVTAIITTSGTLTASLVTATTGFITARILVQNAGTAGTVQLQFASANGGVTASIKGNQSYYTARRIP